MRHFAMAALLASILIGFGAAASAQQFAAEIVSTGGSDAAGGENQPRKIYVANGKVRTEMGGRTGGVLIADSGTKTGYMLLPQLKAYMDAPHASRMMELLMPVEPNSACSRWQEMARAGGHGDAEGWTCERVGSEALSGRNTDKYRVTSPKGEQHFIWVDSKLRFLLKTQDPNGRGMELKNIEEGPQPASLFDLPSDYHKMDMQQMLQQHGGK